AIVPWRLAPGAPAIRIELIAQNGEQPSLQVRARAERVARLPGFGERFLREIVRQFAVAAKRTREGAQERNEVQQITPEFLVEVRNGRSLSARAHRRLVKVVRFHDVPSFLPLVSSIFLSRSRKSSGTGS